MMTNTAIADAFARAIAAKKIDIVEVPRASDGDAREMFKEVRWAETDGRPHCIYCGAEKPYPITTRPGVFKCRFRGCNKMFSITAKTVFASHKMPLQGCLVALGSVVDDAGLRTIELAEATGVTYKAAWSMGRKLGLRTREERANFKPKLLNYPYRAVALKGDDYDLLMAINAVASRGLPEAMRADVCQEVALGVLCGDYSRDNLAAAVEAERKKYNREWGSKWDHFSLDAPIGDEDGGRWIDMLDADTGRIHQRNSWHDQ